MPHNEQPAFSRPELHGVLTLSCINSFLQARQNPLSYRPLTCSESARHHAMIFPSTVRPFVSEVMVPPQSLLPGHAGQAVAVRGAEITICHSGLCMKACRLPAKTFILMRQAHLPGGLDVLPIHQQNLTRMIQIVSSPWAQRLHGPA